MKNIIDQMALTHIHRTFHITAAEHMFFSGVHRTIPRIGHMLGDKTRFSKFKKTEIISGISSEHNVMKLKINDTRKAEKFTNMWKLNNTLLNNKWVKKGNKRGTKKHLETNNNETQHTKTYGRQQSSSKRKVYSDKCLHQGKKISSKQPNFILELLEKEEQTKPKAEEGK